MLENDVSNNSWWVPLKIMTPTYTQLIFGAEQYLEDKFDTEISSTWLKPNETRLIELYENITNSWYLLNPNQFGYYRVNYDACNWKALKKLLRSSCNILTGVTRAALIDDAFNLARSSLQNYELPLSLAKYLRQEEDYEPWVAATRAFLLLHKKLRDRTDVQLDFQVRCTLVAI